MTAHLISRLDPDGAEPRDRAAKRKRHFTIGKLRDGTVPVRGELLPEVAAQLQKLINSLLNPKVDPDAPVGGNGHGSTVQFRPSDEVPSGDVPDGDDPSDDALGDDVPTDAPERDDDLPEHVATAPPAEAADLRTHAQKRHDALATSIIVAAASGGMPQLGGAAPTLTVSVSAGDYANNTGHATIEGAGFDVPLGAAEHAACAGGVERVLFDEQGTIVGISTSARIFNSHQRRAIVLRDRRCLIPGCVISAEWCEIHHVTDAAHGGPTHTSNGVPLCWLCRYRHNAGITIEPSTKAPERSACRAENLRSAARTGGIRTASGDHPTSTTPRSMKRSAPSENARGTGGDDLLYLFSEPVQVRLKGSLTVDPRLVTPRGRASSKGSPICPHARSRKR